MSLTGFAQAPLVLLTISTLIILGGTGFAVISEVLVYRLRWRRFSLHAKLSLINTGALLLAGTALGGGVKTTTVMVLLMSVGAMTAGAMRWRCFAGESRGGLSTGRLQW